MLYAKRHGKEDGEPAPEVWRVLFTLLDGSMQADD